MTAISPVGGIVYSTTEMALDAFLEKTVLDRLQLQSANDVMAIQSEGIHVENSMVAYRYLGGLPYPRPLQRRRHSTDPTECRTARIFFSKRYTFCTGRRADRQRQKRRASAFAARGGPERRPAASNSKTQKHT